MFTCAIFIIIITQTIQQPLDEPLWIENHNDNILFDQSCQEIDHDDQCFDHNDYFDRVDLWNLWQKDHPQKGPNHTTKTEKSYEDQNSYQDRHSCKNRNSTFHNDQKIPSRNIKQVVYKIGKNRKVYRRKSRQENVPKKSGEQNEKVYERRMKISNQKPNPTTDQSISGLKSISGQENHSTNSQVSNSLTKNKRKRNNYFNI